jgi:hypothetical protein
MARRAEVDLDAALAALARDVRAGEPRPDAALFARVWADAALTALAAEAQAASPRPGPALVARVLADAASVAADRSAPALRPRSPAGAASPGARLRPRPGAQPVARFTAWVFGWAGGAVAAMALGLAVGVGVGLEAAPGSLPVLDQAEADPLALAELEPTMLFVDGL